MSDSFTKERNCPSKKVRKVSFGQWVFFKPIVAGRSVITRQPRILSLPVGMLKQDQADADLGPVSANGNCTGKVVGQICRTPEPMAEIRQLS